MNAAATCADPDLPRRPRPSRLRFPRSARLALPGEFRCVKEHGRSWGGKLLVLGVLSTASIPRPPDNVGGKGARTSRADATAVVAHESRKPLAAVSQATGPARIGFITSRRVGPAVIRNQVRRRLREAVRASRSQLRPGLWLVLIARHTAARATAAQLAGEWLRLAGRASILLPAAPVP